MALLISYNDSPDKYTLSDAAADAVADAAYTITVTPLELSKTAISKQHPVSMSLEYMIGLKAIPNAVRGSSTYCTRLALR